MNEIQPSNPSAVHCIEKTSILKQNLKVSWMYLKYTDEKSQSGGQMDVEFKREYFPIGCKEQKCFKHREQRVRELNKHFH